MRRSLGSFAAVFRFFVPPAGLEKAVKKGKKGREMGAWENTPIRSGGESPCRSILGSREKGGGENVSSGSDIYGLHSG